MRERERYSAVTVSRETGFYRVISPYLEISGQQKSTSIINYKRAKSDLMCQLSELSNTDSKQVESYFQIA